VVVLQQVQMALVVGERQIVVVVDRVAQDLVALVVLAVQVKLLLGI
jgi:hypothetical protein